MDFIAKNLWLNLTVVFPWFVTYGTWRLVVSITGYNGINFTAFDASLVLSLSVLFTVAFIQQAIGISIEALLAMLFKKTKDKYNGAYLLFVERFSFMSELKEEVKQTIGQFFLSLNLAVGQTLIMLFIIVARNSANGPIILKPSWLYIVSSAALLITIAVTVFRFRCAIKSLSSTSASSGEGTTLTILADL